MRKLMGAIAVLSVGCAKVFFQEDGFSDKVRAGCKTEEACRRLLVEAEQRTMTCKDNTVGYVRCDVARADKHMAESYVKSYEEERKRRADEAREAETERRRAEAEHEREARSRAQEDARRASERERLGAMLEAESRTIETCAATEQARAARSRREEILRNQAPGATVRKQCTPRTEVHAVKSECKDANGFTRTCTKSVAGDVVGYVCPKTMDAELVQLGLYQLDLLDRYPFPEDRTIRVSDESCNRAKTRAGELRTKLEAVEGAKKAEGGR